MLSPSLTLTLQLEHRSLANPNPQTVCLFDVIGAAPIHAGSTSSEGKDSRSEKAGEPGAAERAGSAEGKEGESREVAVHVEEHHVQTKQRPQAHSEVRLVCVCVSVCVAFPVQCSLEGLHSTIVRSLNNTFHEGDLI